MGSIYSHPPKPVTPRPGHPGPSSRAAGRRAEESTLGHLERELGADQPLASITAEQLTAAVADARGMQAPATWNRHVATVRSFLGFCRRRRWLVEDLTDTMLAAPGAGLAAPQIGVGLRAFTWNVEGQVGHLINPRLELSADTQDGPEGCLSIPELSFDCTRALSVVAHGFDMYGEPVTIAGSDYLSRAIQHETDHLDGVLFIDRLDPATRKAAMKAIREAEWFGLERPTVKLSPHATRGLGL